MKDLKKLFEILKDKRIEKGYSFRQLENILNGRDQKISYSTLQKLENGEFNTISIELLTELCKIYNLNYIEMLELSGVDKRLLNLNQESNIKSIEEVEHFESFIVKISGESMEPNFYNGDRLIVDTTQSKEWQFLEGYVVVVQINHEVFIKLVKFENSVPEFHSLNKKFVPIKIKDSDKVKCIGVVTEILNRKIGKIK